MSTSTPGPGWSLGVWPAAYLDMVVLRMLVLKKYKKGVVVAWMMFCQRIFPSGETRGIMRRTEGEKVLKVLTEGIGLKGKIN